MVNIKVAVRIKPLSEREILNGEDIIVRKEENSVFVTIPKIPGRQDGDGRPRTKRFVVDFCYDPAADRTGTQKAVYEDIGSGVLDSMFEGYNACVLAYGHSASGKTYTIMGAEDDPGLTPRICRGLFEKLEDRRAENGVKARVVVSFLEIYNEKVRDLLGDEDANFSLRVREHPKLGPYVQGLKEHLATDERELLELLATGAGRRITATTENNARSSRSHAVFSLRFIQSDGENYETEKSSKVHLVDLAGSERAGSSQSKTRLKEGANINKSLATLGNVISALADACEFDPSSAGERCSSRPWQPFVPYRDSVLTWLLKDTLGGNSNTVMIATISSASGSVGETLNTLRYAKRTKRIVNRPIINEDPKVRTIRELREEILRLKRLLFAFQQDEDPQEFAALDLRSRWSDTGGGTDKMVGEKKQREGVGECRGAGIVDLEGGRGGDMGVSREGDACETSREKESDVTVSVNDNFSHEARLFSDSLESFSSDFAETGNSRGSGGNCSTSTDKVETETPNSFSSDNFFKRSWPRMLHRSRPDLIRGISTRSKESVKSGSGQSSVDVSNLSQSTSENSLNSLGSLEAQPSERSTSPEAGERETENKNIGGRFSAKEKKRSNVAEIEKTKKSSKHRLEMVKKQEKEEERKEGKLCKRARMKLFDLSRKLALAKIGRKTVDSDTQTDHVTRVIRVKEKCVATDFEKNSVAPPEKDGCVVTNRVFVPGSSNHVSEDEDTLRIHAPPLFDRRETATQTVKLRESYELTDADSFSEDSLDLEDKRGSSRPRMNRPGEKNESLTSNDLDIISKEPKKQRQRFLMEMYLDRNWFFNEPGEKEGNLSSENSLTSTEGTNPSCASETSSEDFEFYENPEQGKVVLRAKSKGDRELYTITENSEQSDASEGFSPVQSRSCVAEGKSVTLEHWQQQRKKSSKNCGTDSYRGKNEKECEPTSAKAKQNSEVKSCFVLPRDGKAGNRLSNSRTQYLNLNIAHGSSPTPFTVDTHLFEKIGSEESEETLFNSVDSMTFFFMGPAKPETSVLMELIKRSFGKSVHSREISCSRGKPQNKGVQCNVGLPRSVSVDTAMMALTRIAKNQGTSPGTSRTFSLVNLTPEDFVRPENDAIPTERGTATCSNDENDARKSALKSLRDAEQERMKSGEKCKKTVTWSGRPDRIPGEPFEETSEFPTGSAHSERKVRFYHPESEDLAALLKEATQLLTSVNSKTREFESLGKKEIGRNGDKKSIRRSRTESCLEKEGNENTWRWKAREQRDVESNATWPRRRAVFGKPPSGAKPRTSQSSFPPRFDSLQSRARSQSPRTVSSARSWDLSSLSVSLCRFCATESPSGTESPPFPFLGRRHVVECESRSLYELEKDLEECCRRLEMTVEEDEERENRSERTTQKTWWRGNRKEGRRVTKRRRRGECAGECEGCDSSWQETCRDFRSRGSGSSFELDSFGPGAKHCHESCMFCRKRESEAYSSALNLNSDCSLGLCRLKYYGFCPCSSTRLKRVVASPRAYMHHLLTQRRLIVGQSRRNQGVGENLGEKWRADFHLRQSLGWPREGIGRKTDDVNEVNMEFLRG